MEDYTMNNPGFDFDTLVQEDCNESPVIHLEVYPKLQLDPVTLKLPVWNAEAGETQPVSFVLNPFWNFQPDENQDRILDFTQGEDYFGNENLLNVSLYRSFSTGRYLFTVLPDQFYDSESGNPADTACTEMVQLTHGILQIQNSDLQESPIRLFPRTH